MRSKEARIEKGSRISIRRQCELLGINRSKVYYHRNGLKTSEIEILHKIDEHVMPPVKSRKNKRENQWKVRSSNRQK